MPKIQKLHVPDQVNEDFVVVIDVIRAFTTAAHAFAQGADKIIPVSTVEEAFSLKRENPEYLLIGEAGGLHIDGFDYGNSPTELSNADLQGKTLVQRTSAGTQGARRSLRSKKILASSFVCAKATLERTRYLQPDSVTFVITGARNGDEDRALADYLEELLFRNNTDPQPYLQRVVDSPAAHLLSNPKSPHFSKEDLEAVLEIDKFSFSMEIFIEEKLPVLRATSANGVFLSPKTSKQQRLDI